MNTLYSAIVTRINGDDILASWFNQLRDAGINIESWLGTFVVPTNFTVANNVSSPTDITGLLLDHTLYRTAEIDVMIYRKTTGGGATEACERIKLIAAYSDVAATWEFTDLGSVGDSGVTISIVEATGQFQYTSTNYSGTPSVSKLTFTIRSLGT